MCVGVCACVCVLFVTVLAFIIRSLMDLCKIMR